jgi:hypothetical protein
VCTILDNEGSVPSGTQTSLEGGGSSEPSFKWLYPYDQTLFPRGLLSPTLQFGGETAQFAYVHISCSTLDYKGLFAPKSPLNVSLTQPMWDAVLNAVQSSKDPVTVDVTKMSNGSIAGPIHETWYVAQGTLRGTIYYETYYSSILGGSSGVGIMKIQPGASTPTPVKSGCANVCHTVSADGSMLVSTSGNFISGSSSSFDLKTSTTVFNAPSNMFTYGGIYPDGSLVMSATNYRLWSSSQQSRLYSTKSGANIPAPGWDGLIKNAGTTVFSPDGKMLAFIHEDKDRGHTLATMSYDNATHSFSNLTDVVSANGFVAWPAFTPDSQSIVYHVGSSPAFETDQSNTGDVYAVDIATRTAHRLDALDGYTGSGGASYLPANDPGLSFAPTVLPEAVGGYFWVVFTTHRSYGSTIASKASLGGTGNDDGKLWVAALDIGQAPGTDGSHPAFYLDGQELQADNLRGFWVLDPCQQSGASCTGGDQCCGGRCRNGVCGDNSGGCSNEYEACTSSADCCKASDQCINGFCSIVVN